METIKIILLIVFYFGFPVLIIWSTQKADFLKKLGAVVIAYILGLLVGNVGIFPRISKQMHVHLGGKAKMPVEKAQSLFEQGLITSSDLTANQIAGIQNTLISAVILLAIPMLLFSLDIKKWVRLAQEAIFSLFLAMISLLSAVFVGYYFYKDLVDESWKVSGMLIGLYTGGSPNLAAISTALEINANTFILTHTYDIATGVLCLVFLMTFAQRLFNLFLPSFESKHSKDGHEKDLEYNEDMEDFKGILSGNGLKELLKTFGFSLIIVAIGGGLSLIVPERSQMATIILTITTLGLLFSNWKVVHRIKHSFQLGMYLIIVFSLIIASMGDLSNMFHVEYLHLFSFVAVVLFGSILIHVFLSYLFRVDSDTTIVTITALAYSPPFVPAVAGALKNKNIIISGLTVGILGYAIGNYLGIAIAYYLQ